MSDRTGMPKSYDEDISREPEYTPESTSLEDEDLINYGDVTARIAHLESTGQGCSVAVAPGSCELMDCPRCEGAARAELEALHELQDEMKPVNEYSGRASAIRYSYVDTFARDEIEDVAGIDAVSILGPYVDWDRLREARQGEMTETTFLGTVYFITS